MLSYYDKYFIITNSISKIDHEYLKRLEDFYNELSNGLYYKMFKYKNITKSDIEFINKKYSESIFYRDKRDTFSFIHDVFIGWLCEDYISLLFIKNGLETSYYDSCSRQLVTHTPSKADLLVKNNNKTLAIEIVTNWPIRENKTFWEINGYIDFRHNKLLNLINISKQHNVIILFFMPYSSSSFYAQVKEFSQYERVYANEFGGKSSLRVKLYDLLKNKKHVVETVNDIIHKLV
ncbi:MAG: hypothetical protein QW255_04745 [Candidatus Bilamarchaeaceae archaeon]